MILAFALAQLAWLGLLGLWIYWYVKNYLIFKQVGDELSPEILLDNQNVAVFVGGIILIVGIATVLFIIFRNLTVQLKLTRLYDTFIANITHELKSPLSSIQLYLETLDSRTNIPIERQREFYSIMLKDANRLNKLISSILEISRLEQKHILRDYHVYNADDIFCSLINESKTHFRLKDNQLNIEGNTNVKCMIDKDAMQIVFDNLTDNAIKYSAEPVNIHIKLSSIGNKLLIEFCDQGIGIAQKDQKSVFLKFQRISNKNTSNVKGTGLGLYWVKEIIKFHHGRISLFSEGMNKGTTIKIELPVYKGIKRNFANFIFRSFNNKKIATGSADATKPI